MEPRGWGRAALLMSALLGACAEPPLPMTDAQFIETVVALRQQAAGVGTAEEFVPIRESVLREAGVTEAQLRAFVRERGRQPRELAAVWDSIDARLRGPRIPKTDGDEPVE